MTCNVYKEVIKSNVNPAMWCTEPVAVAYATSALKKYIDDIWDIEKLHIKVDWELYKNAVWVYVPNSQWGKWLEVAAALGIVWGNYEEKLEVLKDIQTEDITKANDMIKNKIIDVQIDRSKKELFVEAEVYLKNGDKINSIIKNTHSNLVSVILNWDIPLYNMQYDELLNDNHSYEEILENSSIDELIKMAKSIDDDDIDYIKKWIDMNMEIADKETEYKWFWSALDALSKKWMFQNDIVGKIKILTTKATDARMSGLNMPVMSSGGSWNQWIISILVPYLYGKNIPVDNDKYIDERVLYESIAFSHLLNSYVKCFTWKLSSMCGCAVAAWLWAAWAIAYQRSDQNREIITHSINNLISDISGMLCDWAKLWCANKISTAVECSISAALKAIEWYHVTPNDGIIWNTMEDSIKNLWKVAKIGMYNMNHLLLDVLHEKRWVI